MKIIDAYWEKRNLGVDCMEIVLQEDDSISEVEEQLLRLKAGYLVLKIPSGMPKAMCMAERLGYRFIEGSIEVTNNLQPYPLPPLVERLNAKISHKPMSAADIEIMYAEISKGMFTTDRISMDPHFTPEQAARRYINWIDDELQRGSIAYKVVNKDKDIGFFIYKETALGICYPFLVGMYEKYAKSGLGIVAIYKAMEEACNRGMKQVSTVLSTNNRATVRIHSMLGYVFEKINYVYVKHTNGGTDDDESRKIR